MTEPVHIISLGAGVQSSTMALMAACGELTPMPAAAIFADTQGEPDSVYSWLDWLETQLPFPVYRVTAGSLADKALTMKTSKRTGRLFSSTDIPVFTKSDNGIIGKIHQRGCTRDFKIYPILRKCRDLAGKEEMRLWRREFRPELRDWAAYHRQLAEAKRKAKSSDTITLFGVEPAKWNAKVAREVTHSIRFPHASWNAMQANPLIVQWIGISTDEASRMKPSRDPWALSDWPLINTGISRQACRDWMLAHGFPEPPRSACVYCPFHDDREWLRLLTEEPAEFAKAAAFEKALQANKAATSNFTSVPYLHRSCVPLDEIDFQALTSGPYIASGFDNECEGMCGV